MMIYFGLFYMKYFILFMTPRIKNDNIINLLQSKLILLAFLLCRGQRLCDKVNVLTNGGGVAC